MWNILFMHDWNVVGEFVKPKGMVKKKHGTLRMCIDFRELNKKIVKNKYPIQRIYEIMNEIHGSNFFLNIDLRSGYHQI